MLNCIKLALEIILVGVSELPKVGPVLNCFKLALEIILVSLNSLK